MPTTQSAKRALRRDIRRKLVNLKIESRVKRAVKEARAKKTKSAVTRAVKELDWAAKKRFLHKNKASRLKSRLARVLVKTA